MIRILPLLILCWLLAPVAARGEAIKLATWNLAWLTTRPAGDPMLPGDVPGRDAGDLAKLRDYARRLAADVVAVQEVDGPEAAALVFDPAEWAMFFPGEDDVQRAGILVRRRLRAVQNPDLATLDLNPEARFSLRRGVDVTVEAGGSHLRLLSVHLKAGCRQEPLESGGRDCDALRRQRAALTGWVAERRREGAAWAVLGDLNRRLGGEDDPFLAPLRAGGPVLRATEGRGNPCWGGRPFIDHLLLGGAAAGWLVPDSLRVMVYAEREPQWRDRLSDHCPVSVQLELP